MKVRYRLLEVIVLENTSVFQISFRFLLFAATGTLCCR